MVQIFILVIYIRVLYRCVFVCARVGRRSRGNRIILYCSYRVFDYRLKLLKQSGYLVGPIYL